MIALAPTAADGHAAHLALRSEPGDREFAARRAAGHLATEHLVRLAEPLVRHLVREVRPISARSAIVGTDDLLNIGRAAVARGIWAYSPERVSGPDYLQMWISGYLRRGLTCATSQLSAPARAHQRFIRISATRRALTERLGQPPTDHDVLRHACGTLTQHDLDDERVTRARRTPILDPRLVSCADTADHTATELFDAAEQRAERTPPGWWTVLHALALDDRQREIVARHAALPPYEHLDPRRRSERAIAADLGITRNAVRTALQQLRARTVHPASPLRSALARLSPDDSEGLGLRRFAQALDTTAA